MFNESSVRNDVDLDNKICEELIGDLFNEKREVLSPSITIALFLYTKKFVGKEHQLIFIH